MNIFNLFGKLTLDTSDYEKGVETAKKENKQFEESTTKSTAKAVIGWTAVATAIVGIAVKMKDLIYNTTEYAGAIKDLSQVYETTYRTVQELNYIAQESGKNAEWVLRKARASGESYAKILGLSNEEYAEMIANAEEMGLIMEDEILDKADELGDRISAIKYQWQAVLVGLLAGEEDAEANLEKFFERVNEVVENFTPRIISFVVKLLGQITLAIIRVAPKMLLDIIYKLIDVVLNIDWIEFGWNIAKAILAGFANVFIKSFNNIFGWLGLKIPEIDVAGSTNYTTTATTKNDYEVNTKTEQTLNIKIESEGVTENDKLVASSLEDLIDEKIGKMLGGI